MSDKEAKEIYKKRWLSGKSWRVGYTLHMNFATRSSVNMIRWFPHFWHMMLLSTHFWVVLNRHFAADVSYSGFYGIRHWELSTVLYICTCSYLSLVYFSINAMYVSWDYGFVCSRTSAVLVSVTDDVWSHVFKWNGLFNASIIYY